MNFNIRHLLIFVCLHSLLFEAEAQVNLYGDLEFGPFEVGLKHLTYNYSTNESTRQIHIALWYPAKRANQQLTFSNYLDYRGELNQEELLRDISIGMGGQDSLFSRDSLAWILRNNMKATREPEAEIADFPLLVWSVRYGTLEYQNIISEYLSSHGYVVAMVEDYPNSPYPWQYQNADDKEQAVIQQITDINRSIDYLKRQPQVDENKVGLLSWSYGGESAILTQMDNPEIDLVVGLSSIGFTYGIHFGSNFSKKVDPDKIDVPYLMLFETIAPNGNTRTPPELFTDMHADSRYVSFKDLAHGNFNALEGMIPGILNTHKVQSWSKGGLPAKVGYEAICKITLIFLNVVFRESDFSSFDEGLRMVEKDLPVDFISIQSPQK